MAKIKNILGVLFCYVSLLCIYCKEFPRGHLQPLGSHRDPDPVDEFTLDQMPSALDFWNDYVLPSKPVVFRGAASKSPGSWLWTDSYLKEKYGDLEVRLEGHKEKAAGRQYPEGDVGIGRDTIRHFVNTYRNSKKYVVSELPKQMFHEVKVLPFLGCSPYKEFITEVDIWMNGNNASSIMHKDAFNQMNCLYNGTKKWKLIAFKYEDKIYKKWTSPDKVSGMSKLNVSSVDLLRYPKVAEVPWQYTVVNAGDCLYLPGSMYHQVQSSGAQNIAVSLLIRRFQYPMNGEKIETPDFSKCENNSLAFKSLDEFELDWAYPGTGPLSMGNAELYSIRKYFLPDMYDKKGKLSKKKIIYTVKTNLPEYRYKVKEAAARIYNRIIELIGSDKLPSQEFLSNKTLVREIAWLVEPEETSNNYNLEYSVVNPEDIMKVLRVCLKKGDGKGSRQHFKKLYVESLFGTEKFADKFLNSLAGNDEFFTEKHVKDNLETLLFSYELYHNDDEKDKPSEEDGGDLEKSHAEEYTNRLKAVNEADDPEYFKNIFNKDNDDDDDGEGDQNEDDERSANEQQDGDNDSEQPNDDSEQPNDDDANEEGPEGEDEDGQSDTQDPEGDKEDAQPAMNQNKQSAGSKKDEL